MENAVEKKSKFNLKLWLPIFIGIFAIGMAFVTFIAIYNSVPHLLLIKHDYDIFNNPDKKELTAKDVYYSPLVEEDQAYFTVENSYILIDLEKLRNDNPSYVYDEYRFEISAVINKHKDGEDSFFFVNCSIDGSTPQSVGKYYYKDREANFEMVSFNKSNNYAKLSFTFVELLEGSAPDKLETFNLMLYGVKK